MSILTTSCLQSLGAIAQQEREGFFFSSLLHSLLTYMRLGELALNFKVRNSSCAWDECLISGFRLFRREGPAGEPWVSSPSLC